jgi:hypothetical protein
MPMTLQMRSCMEVKLEVEPARVKSVNFWTSLEECAPRVKDSYQPQHYMSTYCSSRVMS